MQRRGPFVLAVLRVNAIGIRRQMIFDERNVAAFSRVDNAAFANNAGNGASLPSE